MSIYDKFNVPRFEEGEQSGYLCSLCGQPTSLDDSMSYQGWNLICCRCEIKLRNIMNNGKSSVVMTIQDVGKLRKKKKGGYG